MTWTRKELKAKAKQCLSVNYWKLVLVSLILMLVFGGSAGGGGRAAGSGAAAAGTETAVTGTEMETSAERLTSDPQISIGGIDTGKVEDTIAPVVGTAVAAAVILCVIIAALAVIILIYAFVINPLQAGCMRFFIRNLNGKAEVKEIAYGYDHGYRNVVKTLFLRELRTFLWMLLFIIPGIIKIYEYRMIPYLLAENPELTTDEVFAQSKEMMTGSKWKTFVLDLSFLGWDILSLLTAGLLGVFYVNPYRNMTFAALYEKLRYSDGNRIAESAQ